MMDKQKAVLKSVNRSFIVLTSVTQQFVKIQQSNLQSNSSWPNINFKARKGIKTICNLWRLECWWTLACPTCIIYSKYV